MKISLFKGAKVASMMLVLFYMGLTAAQQSPTFTSEQLERLRIREVPNKEGLYIMPGFDGGMSGGNIAILVTDEGVIVVDNKYSYSYENIIKQIASVTSLPIRYVLNTHHHFDHAGSNASFMPSAQVIGHENVRINMLRNVGPSASSDGAPRITFSDKTSIHLGNAEVQAHHLGCGHTNGDSGRLWRRRLGGRLSVGQGRTEQPESPGHAAARRNCHKAQPRYIRRPYTHYFDWQRRGKTRPHSCNAIDAQAPS